MLTVLSSSEANGIAELRIGVSSLRSREAPRGALRQEMRCRQSLGTEAIDRVLEGCLTTDGRLALCSETQRDRHFLGLPASLPPTHCAVFAVYVLFSESLVLTLCPVTVAPHRLCPVVLAHGLRATPAGVRLAEFFLLTYRPADLFVK